MSIKSEFADKFIAKYKDFEIVKEVKHWRENDIDKTAINLIVKNPNGGHDIMIMYDGDPVGYDEIIISYSYTHNHLGNWYYEEKFGNLVDYYVYYVSSDIDEILQSKIIAVGFLVDDKPIFCTAIEKEEIEKLSRETILEKYKKYLPHEMKGCNCICSIRDWNNIYSCDMNFVIS